MWLTEAKYVHIYMWYVIFGAHYQWPMAPIETFFCPLVRLGLVVLQEETRPSLTKGQKRFLCMISARFASKQSFMSIYWGGRFIRTHSHQRPDYTLYSFESTCTCINLCHVHLCLLCIHHSCLECIWLIAVFTPTPHRPCLQLFQTLSIIWLQILKKWNFLKAGRSPSSYIFNNIVLEIFKPLHTFVHQIRSDFHFESNRNLVGDKSHEAIDNISSDTWFMTFCFVDPRYQCPKAKATMCKKILNRLQWAWEGWQSTVKPTQAPIWPETNPSLAINRPRW